MMIYSPLRYPGGKAKLYPFFTELIKQNDLFGSEYCEPYAGGAGLALSLLSTGFVEKVSINDVDRSIFAFWISVLYNTAEFCKLIEQTVIDIDQWRRQREIWTRGDIQNSLELGFSAYFLNRTNRSGIIDGAGPIGGYDQSGRWKIDARLVREKQVANIYALSKYANQIEVSNLDAEKYMRRVVGKRRKLVYLDPPYFVKGRKLYKNSYQPGDHMRIAKKLELKRCAKWVVSYDNVPEIRDAYCRFSAVTYSLNYSAGEKKVGSEVIFVSDALTAPEVQGFRTAA